jgi:ribosomal protein S21
MLSIEVLGGNVDRALRKFKRMLVQEGMAPRQLRNNLRFVKPSEEQRLEEETQRRRIARKAIKEQIGWIMWKKNRGF